MSSLSTKVRCIILRRLLTPEATECQLSVTDSDQVQVPLSASTNGY